MPFNAIDRQKQITKKTLTLKMVLVSNIIMAKAKISIVVPVYNEVKSVLKTINSIKKIQKKIGLKSEIICVDDASTDGSYEPLRKINGIKVIKHKINRGYGASLKTGIKQAEGDWIIITDADGTYPISSIPRLLKNKEHFDMVIGSRTGPKVSVPLLRRPAKFFLNRFASFLAGEKIPDLNSGLRVFDKDKCLEFWALYPDKFSFTSTITMAFLSKSYKVSYTPINYYKRESKSTISPFDFYNFNQLLLRLTLLFNPLKIFTFISVVLFITAVFLAIYSNYFLGKLMDASIIALVLSSIQIFLFGMLAHVMVKYK